MIKNLLDFQTDNRQGPLRHLRTEAIRITDPGAELTIRQIRPEKRLQRDRQPSGVPKLSHAEQTSRLQNSPAPFAPGFDGCGAFVDAESCQRGKQSGEWTRDRAESLVAHRSGCESATVGSANHGIDVHRPKITRKFTTPNGHGRGVDINTADLTRDCFIVEEIDNVEGNPLPGFGIEPAAPASSAGRGIGPGL